MSMQVVNCPNCNGEVKISESREYGFCTYCGTKILFSQKTPVNATEAFTSNKEAALNELQKIYDFFKPVESSYYAIDSLNMELARIRQSSNTALLIIGVLIACLGFLFLGVRAILIYGIMFIIVGGAFIFGYIRLEQRKNARFKSAQIEIDEYENQIVQRYGEFLNCPIGIDFCHPNVLDTLSTYIRQGRAETIKEAINLMASEMHNAEMRQIALETRNIAQHNLSVNTANMINNAFRK